MSNASRTQLRMYKETAWGETPSNANKMTNVNMVSESFSQQTNTERSKNIRSDGNTPSVNRVGISASGDLNVEMNWGNGLDMLFEGTLRSTFATGVTLSAVTTIAFSSVGNTITDSANGFANVLVGQWIKVSGAGAGVNAGYYRVLTKPNNGTITVEGKILTTATAGPGITIKGSLLKNGTTDQSFLVEIEHNDISTFKYFTGMRIGQNQFTFTPNALVNGSFSLRGKQGFSAITTRGDGSPNAANVTRSMNSVDNVTGIFQDSVTSPLKLTNFTFNMSPQLRDQPVIGSLAMGGIGSGTQQAQISLEAYFDDRIELDKYLNFTQQKMAIVVEDSLGNAYVFDFPSVVPATGEATTGGLDQDVLQKISYEAFLNTTLGATIGITRIAA
jgi:hypothetical protein